MYCVKCRGKTENKGDISHKQTKNKRRLAQTQCQICGHLKSQFVSASRSHPTQGGFMPTRKSNTLPQRYVTALEGVNPNQLWAVAEHIKAEMARDDRVWIRLQSANVVDLTQAGMADRLQYLDNNPQLVNLFVDRYFNTIGRPRRR